VNQPEKIDSSRVEHATLLTNPVSTNSRRVFKWKQRLIKEAPFPIEQIPTSSNPEITQSLIRIAAEHSDLILVAGGDGTLGSVFKAFVVNNLSERAKQTAIWSLGGGNANDGHNALHTPPYRRHPEKVLNNGWITNTYPIRCDVVKEDGQQELYTAAFYATLGASALASSTDYLNRPKHRSSLLARTTAGRVVSEPLIALKALIKAPLNEAYNEGNEKVFLEEMFINSSRMAKFLDFHTNLSQRELFHTNVPNKDATTILPGIRKLIRGTMGGEYLTDQDSYSLTTKNELYAQFDGEAVLIEGGSQLTFSIHDKPIRVVTTNPNL